MRHPARIWTEPQNEELHLRGLIDDYIRHLEGRAEPVSPETIKKYRNSLLSFLKCLESSGLPLTLGSVTPDAVNRWVSLQRAKGRAEDGIASRLIALKVFTNKFLCKYAELTYFDLLSKVPRICVDSSPKEGLSAEERERLLDSFNRPTFEDIRNKALMAVLLATALRYREVLHMSLSGLSRTSGEFTVVAKGGRERPVRIDGRPFKLVKAYLRQRPETPDHDRLWVTEDGRPLSYWGGQRMIHRLKARAGIPRLHAHLLRHTFAQYAVSQGAERAAVQDMLGHSSDAMTRRYAKQARATTAARMMPRYSPIG